eukprot:1875294-Alexandrium_andersonii.AAC.1
MTAKHHFVLFGGEAKVEYAGVGFVFSAKLKPAVKATWAVSPRLAVLVLATAARDATFINVYIPQPGRPLEERQQAF